MQGSRGEGIIVTLFPNSRRLLVHIPVGMVAIFFAAVGAALGGPFLPAFLTVCFIFCAVFLAYEVTQGNKAHIDIASFLWGFLFGAVVWAALALAGVI